MLLVTGIPNSGKSTLSHRLENVLHYDDVMQLPADVRHAMYATADAVEGIFCTRRARAVLLRAWAGRKGPRTCVWLDVPVATCIERERRGRKRHVGTVLHHAARFEPPTLDEGWDAVIRIPSR